MFADLPLFSPLPTPDEMRVWDSLAQADYGIPGAVLMENASREALYVLNDLIWLTPETKILILAGAGNNGGDGYALARHLHDLPCKVLLCHAAAPNDMKGDAKTHARMAELAGVDFLPLSNGLDQLPRDWMAPDVIVDALCGTGLSKHLRESILELVRAVNARRNRSFIFSLDTPTGLCGYTGRPQPEAVMAHATVTFEAAKPGLCFPHAKQYTGRLFPRRIGIPSALQDLAPASWRLLKPKPGAQPPLPEDMHKGNAGRVLVIGGSRGMSGAPLLCALGTLHNGAGLVHLACPGGLAPHIACGVPEVMVHGIGVSDLWEQAACAELAELIYHIQPDAIVIGPGMGRTEGTHYAVKTVLDLPERCPVIADADALYCFRQQNNTHGPDALPLSLLRSEDILTPHPGEMARLLDTNFFGIHNDLSGVSSQTGTVQRYRPEALASFTAGYQSTLILKGAGTLIGKAGHPTVLCPIAAPSLAIGGSGDVLAGTVCALAASGMPSFSAACLGVHMHARAGELLGATSPRGHLASDIARMLPCVWEELCPAPTPLSRTIFGSHGE